MPDPAAIDPKRAKVAEQWKHGAPLMWCRFDPNGTFVFASSEDQSIQRWRLSDQQKTAFQGHQSWVRDLVFSSDGRTLISAGCDDRLIWWETAADDPQPLQSREAHRGWIRAAAVSPDGQLLASGGNDRDVKLWRMDDGSPVRTLQGHEREIYSLAFHPEGEFLLSGDIMGQVRQWEVASGKQVRTFDAQALHTHNRGQRVDYGGVRSIAFSPDRQHAAFSGLHKASNPLGAVNEPLVLRFEWDSGKLVTSHVANGVRGVAWRAVFHPDGHLIACSGGSGGGFLLFWTDQEKPVHKLKLPNTARGLDLHPDGRQLATAHHDGRLRISTL